MTDSPVPTQPVPAELVSLDLKELMKVLGLHSTAIWKLRQEPDFPQPMGLTRKLVWRAADIQRWLEMKKALPMPCRAVHPELALLSMLDLIKLLSVRRSTLEKIRKRPDFPTPVMLTRRRRAWRATDIQQWLEKQPQEGRQS